MANNSKFSKTGTGAIIEVASSINGQIDKRYRINLIIKLDPSDVFTPEELSIFMDKCNDMVKIYKECKKYIF